MLFSINLHWSTLLYPFIKIRLYNLRKILKLSVCLSEPLFCLQHNFDNVVMPLLHNFDYVAGKFFLIKIKPCVFASKGDDEI